MDSHCACIVILHEIALVVYARSVSGRYFERSHSAFILKGFVLSEIVTKPSARRPTEAVSFLKDYIGMHPDFIARNLKFSTVSCIRSTTDLTTLSV